MERWLKVKNSVRTVGQKHMTSKTVGMCVGIVANQVTRNNSAYINQKESTHYRIKLIK